MVREQFAELSFGTVRVLYPLGYARTLLGRAGGSVAAGAARRIEIFGGAPRRSSLVPLLCRSRRTRMFDYEQHLTPT